MAYELASTSTPRGSLSSQALSLILGFRNMTERSGRQVSIAAQASRGNFP